MKVCFFWCLVVSLWVVVIGACSTAQQISITGDSTALAQLKADVSNLVVPLAMATATCKHVDSIHTKVITIDQNIKANEIGTVVQGKIQELWTVQACGKTMPFKVNLIPDGKGGTIIGVLLSVQHE